MDSLFSPVNYPPPPSCPRYSVEKRRDHGNLRGRTTNSRGPASSQNYISGGGGGGGYREKKWIHTIRAKGFLLVHPQTPLVVLHVKKRVYRQEHTEGLHAWSAWMHLTVDQTWCIPPWSTHQTSLNNSVLVGPSKRLWQCSPLSHTLWTATLQCPCQTEELSDWHILQLTGPHHFPRLDIPTYSYENQFMPRWPPNTVICTTTDSLNQCNTWTTNSQELKEPSTFSSMQMIPASSVMDLSAVRGC